MAFKLNDRVKESSATTGTGTITLGGAVSGFESFSAGIGGDNTTYYCIFETGTNNFEVGFGTLNSGASTLARTYVISSSNSDAKVNFAGATEVFCTVPGAKIGLPTPEEYGSSSAPKIITVKVGSKTSNHPYPAGGSSSSNAYFLDGLESPALRFSGVDSGAKYYYRFDQSDSSNSSHPLRFYLEADKTTAYTTGVTTNGTAGSSGAYTQIAVDENTPNILYYQCSSHGYMGNHVVNIGNTVNINSVTGQIIPGKLEGTDFTNSLLIGHATTGTLSSAENNTGVGIDALDALTSGDSNVAIGYNAGTGITSGGFNVLMGRQAGENITTTFTTTAIGDQSFKTANTNNNTGLGASAGLQTTGGDNTAIGRSAGQGTAGQSSYTNVTLLGNDAGKALTTGSHNILLGSTCGDNLTTGSGNVLIGSGIDADAVSSARTLKIAGYDGSTTTTWITGDNSGNVTVTGTVTANGETLSAGVSAGFAVAMAIAL